jgi:GNAT superfamily N-acetyltransferase
LNCEIRRANPDHAATLTELAHAAKRHWGYPERWIAHWRDDLTLSERFIAAHSVYAAFEETKPLGFYALLLPGDAKATIEHMWVHPDHMRAGVGRSLFDHAIELARRSGARVLEVLADPNASGFFDAMGAMKTGEQKSTLDGQPRVLPIYRLNLKSF